MLVHGSCAAREGDAVLFLGPPGTGKSDLLLRLLQRPGWRLVADDQVEIAAVAGRAALRPSPPPALRGMLEVRGVGIFTGLPVAEETRLKLVVEISPRDAVPRLPEPAVWRCAGASVPRLALHGFDGSAPEKVEFALAATIGQARLLAGALVA